MKHEVTTLNTKKMLAASLKSYMEKKPLAKITVSEIIKDCGVNRKTFYYHFENIYDLLKWMLDQEAVDIVKQFNLLVDYQDAILFVMDYIDNNKHIINCVLDSAGRDEMKRIFAPDFCSIMRSMIDSAEIDLKLSVDEDFKAFLSESYTELLVGLIISWCTGKRTRTREQMMEYITIMFRSSLPTTLKNADRNPLKKNR